MQNYFSHTNCSFRVGRIKKPNRPRVVLEQYKDKACLTLVPTLCFASRWACRQTSEVLTPGVKEVAGYQGVSHFLSLIEGLGSTKTKALLILWMTRDIYHQWREKLCSVKALFQSTSRTEKVSNCCQNSDRFWTFSRKTYIQKKVRGWTLRIYVDFKKTSPLEFNTLQRPLSLGFLPFSWTALIKKSRR